MADTQWPKKDEREGYEINEFVLQYARLPGDRQLEIIEKREKPDYVVRNKHTGEEFGVELTSTYLSDSSVPDEHIPTLGKGVGNGIRFDRSEIEEYKQRVAGAIRTKVEKARRGYDLSRPLILSVYVNEYRAIFMGREDWQEIVAKNEALFDAMHPFVEVVIWSLPNNDVFLIVQRQYVQRQ